MALKPHRRVPSDIYIGSMADISFLLVIFFIVTSVIVAARGLDLHFAPPPPVDTPEVDPDDSIDVHVLASGALSVDRRPMELAQLLSYIGPKLADNPDKPVILRTDPDALYGSMMVVLDELRQAPDTAGFEIANLVIPTRSEIERDWMSAGWRDDG